MSPTRNGKWIAKSHFRESDIFLEHMQQLSRKSKKKGEEKYFKPFLEGMEKNN